METNKEVLKDLITLLEDKYGVEKSDVNIIVTTLSEIYKKNPYDIKEAIDIIDCLSGYTPETIHKISDKCKRTYYSIAEKSIYYFKQVVKNSASEPAVKYVSSMLKVNY